MVIDAGAVRDMAERYTEAWCSGDPEAVASFYAETGRIAINDGAPSVGRAAIAEMARGFFGEFPDLVVRMDEVRTAGRNALYAWTLEGTHSGTGKRVKVPGWEEWSLSDDVLVSVSRGRFDAAEYERQVAEGV